MVLLANLSGWFSHRQWRRALTGAIGPVLALIGAFGLMGIFGMTRGFLPAGVARGTFYAGLVVMIITPVWNLISFASRHCRPSGVGRSIQRS